MPNTKKAYLGLSLEDREIFYNANLEEALSNKDILILKIYLSFMGKDFQSEKGEVLLGKIKEEFLAQPKENICKKFNLIF